jgi:DinB superfamily
MRVPSEILDSLAAMPDQFERLLRLVPERFLAWEPHDWAGIPGERFAAAGQACHLRDIEVDGYHIRIRRMLEEEYPDLVSLDGYAIARERAYDRADPWSAISAFRTARQETVRLLAPLTDEQLTRPGTFAEYGHLTLLGLVHYLASHDQQHLACMQWLLGKIRST